MPESPRGGRAAPRTCGGPSALADLPDHSGSRDLDEWRVEGILELGRGVGLTEIAHRSIIDEIRASVRAKLQVDGTIDSAESVRERLFASALVEREPRLKEL